MARVVRSAEQELPTELSVGAEVLTPNFPEEYLGKARLLWSARRFLMRVAILGSCVSLSVAFLLPKEYESSTRIMPPDSQSLSGLAMAAAMGSGAGAALGGTAADLLGLKSSGGTFTAILQSRTVQDRIIDRFNLMTIYRKRYRQDARKMLSRNTGISEDRKTGVITVNVTDHDPKRAAAIAHAYIDDLNQLSAELSTSAARRERMFIEDRLKVVKVDLDQASKDFSEFASKNTAIDIKEQGKAMVEAAATLQGQLIAAQSELQGLEQIYTANNVRVRSVRARVQELTRQLEKIGGTDASLSSNDGPSDDPNHLYPSIRKLPLLGVQYADLYRRTKIQETVYELLTQQYELTKIQEAKEIPTVKVLDEADVPEKKSFPPRLLIGLLGMVMSCVLASVWTVAKHKWEATDPANPQKMFAQEVYTELKSDGRQLWKRGLYAPKDVISGAYSKLRFPNGRNGNSE